MAEFGFSASFLKTAPDVAKKVAQATAAGWTLDKFLDELKTTAWWKARSDAQKRYDVEIRENPGQITASVTEKAAVIHRMLITMGMALSRSTVVNLARQAVRNGMSDAELRYIVGTKYSHGGTGGLIGQTRSALVEGAAAYGVKSTPGAVNDAIRAVLQGVRTVADYESYWKETAKKTYSSVADQIDAGFTIKEILDPYIQMAAQELGVNPNTVDISEGKWNAPLTYRAKSTDVARTMTFDEWTAKMRTDPQYGYDKTNNAQRQASMLSTQIMEAFGAMG